jgi:hypothetical protein
MNLHPDALSIFPEVALLVAVFGDLTPDKPVELFDIFLPIFRMSDFNETHPEQLLLRVSGDAAVSFVDAEQPSVLGARLPGTDGRELEEGAVPLLAFAQCLLMFLADDGADEDLPGQTQPGYQVLRPVAVRLSAGK